jgi:hypothetical protein
MRKNVRFAVTAAIAVVLISASYFVLTTSASSPVDPFALTTGAKHLPHEQFDAY